MTETPLQSNNLCIQNLFEQQVGQHPEQTAITFQGQKLSYQELNEKANQIAHYLQQLGAKPDRLVGICLERSMSMVVVLLGILKAGAAYVPLDSQGGAPQSLETIIKNSQIPLLITQSHLAAQLSEDLPSQVIALDLQTSIVEQQSRLNPQPSNKQSDLFSYIPYIGKTAEQPQGIAIEHHNVMALAEQSQQAITAHCWSGVLAANELTSDLSVMEIFGTLAQGGTLILVEDLLSLSKESSEIEIRLIHAIPSMLERLWAEPSALPTSLRIINLAGQPLTPSLVGKLQQLQQLEAVYYHMKPIEDPASVQLAAATLPAIARVAPTTAHGVSAKSYPVDLSRVTPPEQKSLLAWNNRGKNYGSPQCIHQLFERQVERTPHQIALVFGEQQLSYQLLNDRANQLARRLQSVGVGPEVLVGICLERSFEMIVALLAVLKAGGAYLPLDISYPVDRLQYMLENAEAPVLLTQSHLSSQLPTKNIEVICLDQPSGAAIDPLENQATENQATENLSTPVTPENLGYVIYTSGSTGKPKGVAMPQRALVNLLHWQVAESANLQPGARTLQFTPISFDVSFQEIFSSLVAGGTLVLISDEQRRDPFSLLGYLNGAEIERLFLPFVALRQLAEAIASENCLPSQLKEVITAGEQLRITTEISQWFSQMPGCRLHNHYGPSESHVVTAYSLTGDPKNWPVLPPIGHPIANTQIHLLDQNLKAVPLGITGELYISGDCLANGYLNRPEITAERFINHCWDGQSSTVLYRTGDLARYLLDGNIEYLGRGDQQVKIRGYRIEPGEIEALLEKQPDVKAAVVMTREATPGEHRLVAYVLPQADDAEAESSTPLARRLRDVITAQVPDYMVPSVFMVLDSFPLTPSGKVDRRALPIPKWTRTEEGEYVAPKTPLERQLSLLWSELLSIEKIGIHDTFCSLGGHSLLAVQMIYQIKARLKVNLDLAHFLENSTIAGLASLIEQLQNQTQAGSPEDETSAAEGRLDPSIQLPAEPIEAVPNFFLTGATGFLGAYMLADLLRHTRAEVYCLVRATRPAEGLARLKNSLSRYGLWREADAQRIIPIPGSLSLPRLGIQPPIFERLAEKLDGIYHCGAWVNILYPYSVLEASNVAGTEEILRLASHQRVTPVHYISTVDVFRAGDMHQIRTIEETDQGGPARSLFSGYAKSKYVAETLIREAQNRGIPVMIYRPSNIMGDTESGFCPKSSFVTQMIQGSLALGTAPQMEAALNLVPVDYASRAIVQLSLMDLEPGAQFNIVNPKSYDWNALTQWMQDKGYGLQSIPYEAWCAEVINKASQSEDQTLFFLTTFLTNQPFIQKSLGGFHFETKILRNYLGPVNIHCPEVSHELLEKYFASLVSQGLIASLAEPERQVQPGVLQASS